MQRFFLLEYLIQMLRFNYVLYGSTSCILPEVVHLHLHITEFIPTLWNALQHLCPLHGEWLFSFPLLSLNILRLLYDYFELVPWKDVNFTLSLCNHQEPNAIIHTAKRPYKLNIKVLKTKNKRDIKHQSCSHNSLICVVSPIVRLHTALSTWNHIMQQLYLQ